MYVCMFWVYSAISTSGRIFLKVIRVRCVVSRRMMANLSSGKETLRGADAKTLRSIFSNDNETRRKRTVVHSSTSLPAPPGWFFARDKGKKQRGEKRCWLRRRKLGWF